jgi:CubicO group peptidase (beta-lactamase class C family)
MTHRVESTTGVQAVWDLLDEQVAAGRMPGYVAALRIRGCTAIRTHGRTAVDADAPPMRDDTLFRIASLTKPMGGALTLALVRDGVLALDDPAARWLPEAADPRVLVSPDAPLDRTVPAERPVTVRDLLAGTSGWGCVMEQSPLQAAMFERGVFPSALHHDMSADDFVARVTSLPLAFQPGAGWLYETGITLLGTLLKRATGRSPATLFAERITGPLGMVSTGFQGASGRLATAYLPGPDGLTVFDPPDGAFATPPPFERLGGGLVATAPDVLRFYTAMADGGAPVLTADEVALLTADALTPAQRRSALGFLGEGVCWGLGTRVDVPDPHGRAVRPWHAPGRWGWTGGTGTTAYVDPTRDTVAVLLTQRAMTGPDDGFDAFWTAVAEPFAER